MPKYFIFAEKGPDKETIIGNVGSNLSNLYGSNLPNLYGTNTFSKTSPYYNNAIHYLSATTGMGNAVVVKRVIPDDAGVPANITVYIDMVEEDLPNYIRNSTGGLVFDQSTNSYLVNATTPTISGYKIKFISEYSDTYVQLGEAVSKTGTFTNSVGVSSTMYPLIQLNGRYKGSYYNNLGIAITSQYGSNSDSRLMSGAASMIYKLSLYAKPDSDTSPNILTSLLGEREVSFTMRPGGVSSYTGSVIDLDTVFRSNWYNEANVNLALRYKDYEGMYYYKDNYKLAATAIMNKEKQYITKTNSTWNDGISNTTYAWFDFTDVGNPLATDGQIYYLNMFTCKSSKSVNYFTVEKDTSTPNLTVRQSEVQLGTNTPVFLKGGKDGTLNKSTYEALVVAEVAKYGDESSNVQNTARNPESFIYDHGFSMDTKEALVPFITLRKDTGLVLSTYDDAWYNKKLTPAEHLAIGARLKAAVNLAPASVYYGTGVCSAVIAIGSGTLSNDTDPDGKHYPLTLSLLMKTAAMAGSGDGRWNTSEMFDVVPGALITELANIEPESIPQTAKPLFWLTGLIYPEEYNTRQYRIPAVRSVYYNENSVLSSWFTVLAMIAITKISDEAWRRFCGKVGVTDNEFIELVEGWLIPRVGGLFGSIITAVPKVIIDAGDRARGYSWQVETSLTGTVAKTVQVHTSNIYRPVLEEAN